MALDRPTKYNTTVVYILLNAILIYIKGKSKSSIYKIKSVESLIYYYKSIKIENVKEKD
jgi:hypothetical protein